MPTVDLTAEQKAAVTSAKKASSLLPQRLPYGMWTCEDGSRVLFDRNYRPMFRKSGKTVELMRGDEWVTWVEERWFYDDETSPRDNPKTRQTCEAILSAWFSQWRSQSLPARPRPTGSNP